MLVSPFVCAPYVNPSFRSEGASIVLQTCSKVTAPALVRNKVIYNCYNEEMTNHMYYVVISISLSLSAYFCVTASLNMSLSLVSSVSSLTMNR